MGPIIGCVRRYVQVQIIKSNTMIRLSRLKSALISTCNHLALWPALFRPSPFAGPFQLSPPLQPYPLPVCGPSSPLVLLSLRLCPACSCAGLAQIEAAQRGGGHPATVPSAQCPATSHPTKQRRVHCILVLFKSCTTAVYVPTCTPLLDLHVVPS